MGWLRWFLDLKLAGMTVEQCLVAFLWVLGGVAARRILKRVFKRLLKWAEKTRTRFDEGLINAFERPVCAAVVVGGVYGAVMSLPVRSEWAHILTAVFKVIFAAIGVWAAFRLTDAVTQSLSEAAKKTETRFDRQLLSAIRKAVKLFVAVIAFVLILQNLGYSVSGLLAGLGVGGLAVALAAKETLGNLFGSIAIFVDRPFSVGDWIQTGDIEGVVEEVGLRSTRIRTFAKSLITVPNAKLADAAIENWSKMPIRRVKFTLGLAYSTSPSKMRQALDSIRNILKTHDGVDQNFWMVRFRDFGDYALQIFIYYFTKTTNWDEYLAVREDINLKIMEEMERLGVEIAFPTQTVYLRQ